MSTVRFGIVGTGGIAAHHAVALAALGDEAEVVACADVLPGRAAAFAAKHAIPHS